MMTTSSQKLKPPPTRNHRQLANWINEHKLVDDRGRPVAAIVERIKTNTDGRVAGTRFRRIGKGRQGLLLEIWPIGISRFQPDERLYRHESSETYRKHSEARQWVEENLRPARKR
jgi:hypothetical protein